MNYKELNDYELLNLVKDNEEATNILFSKYKPLIVMSAKKLYNENTLKGYDLNDLIQEGMIGFSMAISTFNENKNVLFYTYAKKCIESKILNCLARDNRKKHQILNTSISMDVTKTDEPALIEFIGDNENNPENIIIDRENYQISIKKLEQKLTEFESQVLNLKINGFNYAEIASILDIDKKKVDNALQRIRQKAKKTLHKQ